MTKEDKVMPKPSVHVVNLVKYSNFASISEICVYLVFLFLFANMS